MYLPPIVPIYMISLNLATPLPIPPCYNSTLLSAPKLIGMLSHFLLYWMIILIVMFNSPYPMMEIKRSTSLMLCMNGPTESLHMVKKSCCTHVMDAHGCSPCRMAATPRLRLWLLMALPLAALVVLCHTVPIPSTVHTIASALSTLLTANSSSCVPLRIVIALLSMTEKWCTRLVMTLAISTWKGSTLGLLKAERARVSASASSSSMTCLETSSPPHCQA